MHCSGRFTRRHENKTEGDTARDTKNRGFPGRSYEDTFQIPLFLKCEVIDLIDRESLNDGLVYFLPKLLKCLNNLAIHVKMDVKKYMKGDIFHNRLRIS